MRKVSTDAQRLGSSRRPRGAPFRPADLALPDDVPDDAARRAARRCRRAVRRARRRAQHQRADGNGRPLHPGQMFDLQPPPRRPDPCGRAARRRRAARAAARTTAACTPAARVASGRWATAAAATAATTTAAATAAASNCDAGFACGQAGGQAAARRQRSTPKGLFAAIEARRAVQEERMRAIDAGEIAYESPRQRTASRKGRRRSRAARTSRPRRRLAAAERQQAAERRAARCAHARDAARRRGARHRARGCGTGGGTANERAARARRGASSIGRARAGGRARARRSRATACRRERRAASTARRCGGSWQRCIGCHELAMRSPRCRRLLRRAHRQTCRAVSRASLAAWPARVERGRLDVASPTYRE